MLFGMATSNLDGRAMVDDALPRALWSLVP
jgi:hypothetical protein